jgi:hypothetical protein
MVESININEAEVLATRSRWLNLERRKISFPTRSSFELGEAGSSFSRLGNTSSPCLTRGHHIPPPFRSALALRQATSTRGRGVEPSGRAYWRSVLWLVKSSRVSNVIQQLAVRRPRDYHHWPFGGSGVNANVDYIYFDFKST